MGASSTGPKSKKRRTEENRDDENNQQPQEIPPQLNVDDLENNNHHIVSNSRDSDLNIASINVMLSECDLLNNNTTMTNNNYLTVSLTPSDPNAFTTTLCKVNTKQLSYQLSERKLLPSCENCKDKTVKEGFKKSLKKKLEIKENKKKKKEKPKAPRAPGGVGQGGGGRGRMSEQDQMMRSPRRKLNTKQEK
ncbi:CLUMA_CG015600, isoform A [Clunio marinus]|uniref:CLUMA_CG015600, isoform A n=1 Tax=Clunio marinus TaxID=568069 RepID=A0A1J1IQ09_9DIPT|nr:CLUMA_CG015600, isoform A [Clunio marinus]